jgi:hypothetical protein
MMGFISGSAQFVRFTLEGNLPDNPLEFISERIAAFSFRDIDNSLDEYSVGWVSVVNMFDAGFDYASHINGDYVVLSLRMDERKVSPVVLKKFVQKEEERIKKEKQVPHLSRALKTEIKERVRSELTAKAMPVPTVYDLVWNLSDSTLFFFTTNQKAHTLLEDFFNDCFGVLLELQIPWTTAQHLVDPGKASELDNLSAEIFV